jgi:hypothetical protein
MQFRPSGGISADHSTRQRAHVPGAPCLFEMLKFKGVDSSRVTILTYAWARGFALGGAL